jgi:RimJ/RimL family protein N-acetyltransferase
MNLPKASLLTYGFNKRAIRSYEKVGFKVEGVLKENIYREGQYHDELIMSIFKEEWKNTSANEPVRI